MRQRYQTVNRKRALKIFVQSSEAEVDLLKVTSELRFVKCH